MLFTEKEKEAFKKASDDQLDYETFPDGDYFAVLEYVEAKEFRDSKGKQSKKLLMDYIIKEPEVYEGRKKTHFLSLDNIKQFGFLKQALKKFGIDTNNIELDEVENEMRGQVGKRLKFSLNTNKKGYQNIYIQNVGEFEPSVNFETAFNDGKESDNQVSSQPGVPF